MFEALSGAGLAVRFFLAFLVVLGLIAIAAWAVRRFGAGRLGTAALRGRQPRLSVIERTSVDARRWLYLVRRDNVEHLLLIGGPSDIVVEPNIIRAAPTRDVAAPRVPLAAEPLPRAVPVPVPETGTWPLQPDPVPRAPQIDPVAEQPAMPVAALPTEPAPRAPRESLAALADEIAARPVPPPRGRPAGNSRVPQPTELRADPRLPPPAAPVDAGDAADRGLAEMAHRLEAALRKSRPAADGRAAAHPALPPVAPRPLASPRMADDVDEATLPPPPPPPTARTARAAETRPQRAEGKMADSTKQGKGLYDSLEQEMASLLGRPAGKG